MVMMEEDEKMRVSVDGRLDGFLRRRVDREVFGLGGGTGPSGGNVQAKVKGSADESAA